MINDNLDIFWCSKHKYMQQTQKILICVWQSIFSQCSTAENPHTQSLLLYSIMYQTQLGHWCVSPAALLPVSCQVYNFRWNNLTRRLGYYDFKQCCTLTRNVFAPVCFVVHCPAVGVHTSLFVQRRHSTLLHHSSVRNKNLKFLHWSEIIVFQNHRAGART